MKLRILLPLLAVGILVFAIVFTVKPTLSMIVEFSSDGSKELKPLENEPSNTFTFLFGEETNLSSITFSINSGNAQSQLAVEYLRNGAWVEEIRTSPNGVKTLSYSPPKKIGGFRLRLLNSDELIYHVEGRIKVDVYVPVPEAKQSAWWCAVGLLVIVGTVAGVYYYGKKKWEWKL